jgi:hypothetical protein
VLPGIEDPTADPSQLFYQTITISPLEDNNQPMITQLVQDHHESPLRVSLCTRRPVATIGYIEVLNTNGTKTTQAGGYKKDVISEKIRD